MLDGAATHTVCIPMVAQSKALGILHLRRPGDMGEARAAADVSTRQLAVALAEHLAWALANFTLRASLRAQSVRDPLTGLYNPLPRGVVGA